MTIGGKHSDQVDQFELLSSGILGDGSGVAKITEGQDDTESGYKTPPQTPIFGDFKGAHNQSLIPERIKSIPKKGIASEVLDPEKIDGENLSTVLKKQRIARDKSTALKSFLAQYFLEQGIVDNNEFKDQLALVARNESTPQTDPAGLIEPMLNKFFDDPESKLGCIIRSKRYEHNGEIFTHSTESNIANVLSYEFENPQSKTTEDVAKVVAKFEIIDGFKVEKDGDKFRVDLENQESFFLNSNNVVLWFKRFGYDGEQQNHKAKVNLKLTPLVVNNEKPQTTEPGASAIQEPQTTELVPSAIIVHRGNSIFAGHYVCYLLLKKEGENKWFCFDDNVVSEVLTEQISLDGLPIEASSNCYFIKYSDKSKLDSIIPNVKEISSFDNFYLNHCWFNSAMVFLQSFSEFRELVVNKSKENPKSKLSSYLENISDDDTKSPQPTPDSFGAKAPFCGGRISRLV